MAGLLHSLFVRSAFIQTKIDEETRSRSSDWVKLLRLKKLRLKIKDRILRLMQSSSVPPAHLAAERSYPYERSYVRW